MNNSLASLISVLFASRNQAHVFHLQTTSYAAHKALNEYYDDIIDLADELIESYQGKYGIVYNYNSAGKIQDFSSTSNVILYFDQLADLVDTLRSQLPQDTFIQNQIDTIVELIDSTRYKLKFLN